MKPQGYEQCTMPDCEVQGSEFQDDSVCCRLPGVFEQVLKPPMSGFGLTIYINIYNT